MPFLTLNVNLDRAADALERIADALERAYPPVMIPEKTKPAGIDKLGRQTSRDRWQREQQTKQSENPNNE